MTDDKKREEENKGVLDTSDEALIEYLNNGKPSFTDSPVSSISSLMSEINISDEDEEQ